jgi:hypothetical protein
VTSDVGACRIDTGLGSTIYPRDGVAAERLNHSRGALKGNALEFVRNDRRQASAARAVDVVTTVLT